MVEHDGFVTAVRSAGTTAISARFEKFY